MTSERSWLTQLPADAPERQLLLAGMAARPDEATVDRTWRAFALAVSVATATTAATGTAAASSITTVADSAMTAAGAASSTATVASGSTTAAGATLGATGGLMGLLAAKAIAIGFAAGLGVLGVGEVAHRVASHSSEPAVMEVTPSREAAALRRRAKGFGSEVMAPRESAAIAPASRVLVATGAASSPSAQPPTAEARLGATTMQKRTRVREHGVAFATTVETAPVDSPASDAKAIGPASTATSIRGASLVEQARELAATKRLIDAGSVGEALRRLQASYSYDYASALAEEREALYIDVLARSGRAPEARRRAERFLSSYPASPYQAKMRVLVSSQ